MEDYIDETEEEMTAISNMIDRASNEGLLVEVIWSFSRESKDDSIKTRCFHALYEWDC